MDQLEEQIAEWRTFVARGPAVDGHDVEELETHLRDQIADLDAAGLTADEAFLIAVRRMGGLDALSREFAREHSGRLWRQLLSTGQEDGGASATTRWREALLFAVGAAVTVLVVRRRGLSTRQALVTAAPFVLAALVVNLYPFDEDRRPSYWSGRTCPSSCGSWSPTRTRAASCGPTNDAWTSSGSRASSPSTTC